MISDYDSYYGSEPLVSSWGKVTRRIVDPITFSCHVNIIYVPRIEDSSYETTDIAIGQPRFGESLTTATSNGNSHSTKPTSNSRDAFSTSMDNDNAWTPHAFPPKSRSSPTKKQKNTVSSTKSGDDKAASLGAFFSKASVNEEPAQEADNQSVGSRSISSRSVSERSNAERSRSEEKLKRRDKSGTGGKSNKHSDMMSIDEQSVSDFIEKKKAHKSRGSRNSGGGILGKFLNEKATPETNDVEEDNGSTMSGSTIGSRSVSVLSSAERSKHENRLKSASAAAASKSKKSRGTQKQDQESPKKQARSSTAAKLLKSILREAGTNTKKRHKLQFTEGHDILEVPTLDDKEYYKDWDDIWYTEEELGDMRYEAFLEEAGLDVDEYM